jgi:hypothetical protein
MIDQSTVAGTRAAVFLDRDGVLNEVELHDGTPPPPPQWSRPAIACGTWASFWSW